MKKFISDTYGQEYRIIVHENSDDFFDAELRYEKEWVGKVVCSFRLQDAMVVEDIKIRDDSDPPESGIELILRSTARPESNTRSYRRRGLGTALLKSVIDLAKKKRLKHIYGSIKQKDITITPDLVKYYEKRGFKKGSPYPNCIPNAVAYMYMDLD